MVSVGVVGAPLAILGIALAVDRGGAGGRSGVLLSYLGFVGLSIPVTAWRVLRPLGVGMLLGSFALVLMFFATGGISTDPAGFPGTP